MFSKLAATKKTICRYKSTLQYNGIRKILVETLLVVQRQSLCLPMQEVGVQSLVWKLRSHMPLGQKTKAKKRSNGVTNSIKTLKMIHIKKIFIEKKKRISGGVGLCVYTLKVRVYKTKILVVY